MPYQLHHTFADGSVATGEATTRRRWKPLHEVVNADGFNGESIRRVRPEDDSKREAGAADATS